AGWSGGIASVRQLPRDRRRQWVQPNLYLATIVRELDPRNRQVQVRHIAGDRPQPTFRLHLHRIAQLNPPATRLWDIVPRPNSVGHNESGLVHVVTAAVRELADETADVEFEGITAKRTETLRITARLRGQKLSLKCLDKLFEWCQIG